MNGKYLKYAIGEIFLVMVGILLAVQINEWNESIKKSQEEQFYLKKLQENFSEDLNFIQDQREKAREYIAQVEVIIEESQDSDLDSFSIDFTSAMFGLAGFSPQRATWENLKSTGKLSLIQNQVLTDSLFNYYNFFNNSIEGLMGGIRQYTREIFAPFFLELNEIPLQEAKIYFEKFPANRQKPHLYGEVLKFRNICRFRILLLNTLIREYDNLERLNLKVLEMIKLELEPT